MFHVPCAKNEKTAGGKVEGRSCRNTGDGGHLRAGQMCSKFDRREKVDGGADGAGSDERKELRREGPIARVGKSKVPVQHEIPEQ